MDLKTHDKHSRSNIELGNLRDIEELKSWKTIFYYWPDPPPDDHLHIVVKAPAAGEWE